MTSPDEILAIEAPSRVRYFVLAWLCAGAMLAYLHRTCISVPAEDVQKDLGLSGWQMDLVLGSFFFGYSILQIPSGWLGDRWGSRQALTVFVAVWSVATGLMGLATGFVLALAAWATNGMGQAGIFPCCVKSISHWFPLSQRAFPSGLLGSFMSMGTIAAGTVAWVLLDFLSWREMVLVLAVPGLLYAVGFHAWFRDRPAEHPGVNEEERHLIEGAVAKESQGESRDPEPTPWLVILTSPAMILICLQQFFRACAFAFYGTRFPTYLQTVHGVGKGDSGLLTSLAVLGFALGSLSGGALVDTILRKTGSRNWSRQGVAVGGGLACAVLLAAAYFVGDLWAVMALITVSTFCSGLASPSAYTITIDLGGRHVATVFSTMNMAGNIGAFCLPLAVGRLAEWANGWQASLLLMAALYFAAAVCWVFLNVEKSIVESNHEC